VASRILQAVRNGSPVSWFAFHPEIRSKLILALSSDALPVADVTILTAWQTAELTRDPGSRPGIVVQVVYDYEFWMTDRDDHERIRRALGRRDVYQISTSTAVTKMLEDVGRKPVATIHTGLADGEFGIDSPIEGRGKVVAFQFRDEYAKDMTTALEATAMILSDDRSVRIECFGAGAGANLPKGITSLGRISSKALRALYNRASVFFVSSRYEGWGLPAAEAMACGAAVVATRCGGVEEFVIDGTNGLLVPIEDPRALANAVVGLLNDDGARHRLATNGRIDARLMSSSRSSDLLEKVLLSLRSDPLALE
jgi:hypothetical protein